VQVAIRVNVDEDPLSHSNDRAILQLYAGSQTV
jgi:hypothetical protein